MSMGGDSSWGGRKKNSEEIDLDITPMIDVTFLLLIFFMVASTMQPPPKSAVPAVTRGENLDREYSFTFYITAGESKAQEPEIRDDTNVLHTKEEIAARVLEALNDGKVNIVIYGDGRAPVGFITEVERAIQPEDPDLKAKMKYKYGVRQKR